MSELLKRHEIQVLRRAGHSQPEGAELLRLAAEVLALDRSLARAQRAGGDSGPRIKSRDGQPGQDFRNRSWGCP